MLVVVIVLAVLAMAAIVVAVVIRSRLADQRAVAAAATTTAELTATELTAERTRAEAAEVARDAAEAARDAAEAGRTEAEARSAEVTQQIAAAEARAAEAAARNGIDPDLLWTLERARSERTWRQSVALGASPESLFDGVDHPLREALQVELDAAREDVGAIVELEMDVPPTVSAAGSMLVLRSAQELLVRAFKAAEETTLHVHADGSDVVVTVVATDEEGAAVTVEPLVVPPSADLELTDGGVRIKRALPA